MRVPVLWVAMRRLVARTDTVDDDSAVSTTFGDGVNQTMAPRCTARIIAERRSSDANGGPSHAPMQLMYVLS